MEPNIWVDDVLLPCLVGSASFTRTNDYRGTAKFSFLKSKMQAAGLDIHEGQKVAIRVIGFRTFGGLIERVTRTSTAEHLFWPWWYMLDTEDTYEVECVSWEARLERIKIPMVVFDHEHPDRPLLTAGECLRYLLETYAPNDHMIGDIQDGAKDEDLFGDNLAPLVYEHTDVWAVAVDLARRSGYLCYIDPDEHIYFIPQQTIWANLAVKETEQNYRDQSFEETAQDYYNRVSLAISLEGTTPRLYVYSNAQQLYPKFYVYDPADVVMTPVQIKEIKSVRLNGQELKVGIWKGDQAIVGAYAESDVADVYWQLGSCYIWWDPQMLEPAVDDVLEVEFWAPGDNVIVKVGQPRAGAPGDGIYGVHLQDDSITDWSLGEKVAQAFLDNHCPPDGGVQRAYQWKMYAHEFQDSVSGEWRPQDLMPGNCIFFSPSAPTNTGQFVTIVDVSAEEVEGSDVEGTAWNNWLYTIKAVLYPNAALDYMEVFRAFAELSKSRERYDSKLVDDKSVVNFNLPDDTVTDDVGFFVGLGLEYQYIFRPTRAYIFSHDAAVSEIAVDLQWSEDDGTTWEQVFENTTGDLVLPAGRRTIASPLRKFYKPLDANGVAQILDIPGRSIFKCAVKTGGGGTTAIHVFLAGETRRKVATNDDLVPY